MAFFFQIKALLSQKMHGYTPNFCFWIPRALAKFCFHSIVLNRAKKSVDNMRASEACEADVLGINKTCEAYEA